MTEKQMTDSSKRLHQLTLRLKLTSEFNHFFTASKLRGLYNQIFENNETGFYIRTNTIAVSTFLLNSYNRNTNKRNDLFKFLLDKGIYNFCAVSVCPDQYTIHLQLSNGKVLTTENVVISNRLADTTKTRLAYECIRDMYVSNKTSEV